MDKITYSKLSEYDKPYLLKAISNILHETDAHYPEGSDERSWNWQYEGLPSAESHVYIAKSQNNIIAYYHIPCYTIKINGESLKIGQIQSVAVLREFRGKGVFQRLAAFANEDINKYVDIIYTFPNNKSIHTFIKYNQFDLVSTLPVYILPLNLAKIIVPRFKILKSVKIILSLPDVIFRAFSKRLNKNESVETFRNITPEIENLFSEFGNRYKIRLARNKEYLDWRYVNSPKGKHKIYGLTHEKRLKVIAVVKMEEIFSSKGLVIMDFAYKNAKDLQKLLTNLKHHLSREIKDEITFILVSGLNEGIKRLKYCGFIPIPQKFVPRKLNLLARWTDKKHRLDLTDSSSWLITIGDWDVF